MEPTVALWIAMAVPFVIRKLFEADWRRRERERPAPALELKVMNAVGRSPGLALSVAQHWGPEGRSDRVRVSGVCPLIAITPERAGDIDLGDAAVDTLFAFSGPRSLVCAMMDESTRATLRDLSLMARPDSILVAEGVLRVDARWSRFHSRDVTEVARKALSVARQLQAPADVSMRLAANALNDPQRGVRLTSLRTLLREHGESAAARETLAAAAAHPDPELRLAAATALGAEGRAVLMALARDTSVEDASSASAIEALGGALPLAELERILAASLASAPGNRPPARPSTARACADLLGHLGEAAAPLLEPVVRARSAAVALAGVRALRRIGSTTAVLPLKLAVQEGAPEVRAAAQAALEDIQLGLTGTPGAVSLTGGEAGILSLVEDPAGRVSLPGTPVAKDG